MVEYLVSKGADIELKDKKGVIMYDYSNNSYVYYSSLSQPHTLGELIRAGEDLNPPSGGIYVLIQCLYVTTMQILLASIGSTALTYF